MGSKRTEPSTDTSDSEAMRLSLSNKGFRTGEGAWESCSLFSRDSLGGNSVDDEDELLPIPDRESHTSDMHVFGLYLNRLKKQKRRPKIDQPFKEEVWTFIGAILEKAQPVGYSELPEPSMVSPKGPDDNKAFISKINALDLINPIHPILLSEASGIPFETVLTELLFATKAGMMQMKLTPNCQRCGSAVCAVERFRDLPTDAYCEGCRYHNSFECLNKIKVVFIFNRECLYVLAENFACQPSEASQAANKVFAVVPATFSGSGFRYSLGCGGDKMLRPALSAGKYRMHCPVARTDNYLIVGRDATDTDLPVELPLHVSDIVCRNPQDVRKIIRVDHGKLHVDVYTNTQSFYVLWIQDDLDDHTLLYLPNAERKPFTNAMELLSHATYQYLFAGETEISLQNVLKRMDKISPCSREPPLKKRSKLQSA